MLNHLTVVGLTKTLSIVLQFIFILLIARLYGNVDLGLYALIISIAAPLSLAMQFDGVTKALTKSLETNNLYVVFIVPLLIMVISIASILYGSIFVEDFLKGNIILILALLILKISESSVEVEFAILRRKKQFFAYSANLFARNFLIYFSAIILLIFKVSLALVYLIMALMSVSYFIFRIIRLFKSGWTFNLESPSKYISTNLHLGIASMFKSLGSNVLRYFVVFAYGVSTLGFLAPIFYGLTVMSNLSIIYENVITPNVLKKIDEGSSKLQDYSREIILILSTYVFLVIVVFASSNVYYSFFYDTDSSLYPSILNIFSIGWVFYLTRSILKAISFKKGLNKLQIFLQFTFLAVLIIFLFTLDYILSVRGIAVSYVLASFVICSIYTYFLIKDSKKTIPSGKNL